MTGSRDGTVLTATPQLSRALGWKQASEVAANVFAPLVARDDGPDTLLVSPFLRVIQTATPTAFLTGLPLKIEQVRVCVLLDVRPRFAH